MRLHLKFMKDVVGNTQDKDPRAPSLESLIEGMYLFVNKDESTISVKDLFTKVNRKLRNEELICGDGKHPELDWYLDIERFLVDRGAVVNKIEKRNHNNIMYLRDSFNKINQIKNIE